jgi:hypothetical protein
MTALTHVLAAGLLAVGLGAVSASASPSSGLLGANENTSLVEHAQGYHRNCGWMNNGWFYERGGSRVACRPLNPGRGYVWHREGQRYGWYHTGDRRWHHQNW